MLLRTLGGLSLEGTDFSRPKPLLLLAYLALEGAKERRFLAELFWMGATDGLNRLSTALSRVRRSLPEAVAGDKNRVWVALDCDAQQLLEALEAGEIDRALSLYRGPFLDGAPLRELGEELEEWVYQTREYLAARVRSLHIEQAEAEAARGNYPAAAARAEHAYRLVGAPELEPSELPRVHRLLMAGSSPLATELRREAEEYGVDLEASAEEAKARLLSDIDTTGVSGHRLPALSTPFVGRRRELSELTPLLLDRVGNRLITVVGPGGIGKTRLALAAATDAAEEFEQGAAFVSLAGANTAEQLVALTSQALGLYLTTGDRREQLVRYLRNRQLLLLLDDCENVVSEASLLVELLEAAPRLKILATSRERLELVAETVYALEGMEYRSAEPEALTLLLQRARLARPGFEPNDQDRRQAQRISRLVQGMPLALVLAAGWLDLLTLEEIGDEIERSLSFLEARLQDVPERQRSVRAVFDYSWGRLSREEQEVLARLSVFRGGFGREAARAVAGAGLQTLRQLVHKSLLLSRQPGRFQIHGLLRQYAAERLDIGEGRRLTEERHSVHYLDLLGRSNSELLGPDQGAALRSLSPDFDNIIGAWHTAARLGLSGLINSALGPLHVLLVLTARYYEGLKAFREGAERLTAAGTGDPRLLARLRVHEGSMLARRGEFQAARLLLEEQLPLLEDDPAERGFACEVLGNFILYFQGEIDLGLARLEEALAIFRRVDDTYGVARNLFVEAALLWHKGHFARVEELLLESEALFRELGNPQWLLGCEAGLGLVAYEQGELPRAKVLLEDAAARMEELGLTHSVANAHSNLGQVLLTMGDPGAAAEHLELAVGAFEKVGDPVLWAEAHARLGQAQLLLGDGPGAEEHFRRSLAISLDHGFESSTGLVGLADLIRDRDPDLSLAIYIYAIEHRATPFTEMRAALTRLHELRPTPSQLVGARRTSSGFSFEVLARMMISQGNDAALAENRPSATPEAAALPNRPSAAPDSSAGPAPRSGTRRRHHPR